MRILNLTDGMSESMMIEAIKSPRRIRRLRLKNCSVTAKVWEAICRVKGLHKLDLIHCHVDPIPTGIKNLQSLKRLNLRESDVRDLPRSICEIDALREIVLTCSKIVNLPRGLSEVNHPLTLNLIGCDKLLSSNLRPLYSNDKISIIKG